MKFFIIFLFIIISLFSLNIDLKAQNPDPISKKIIKIPPPIEGVSFIKKQPQNLIKEKIIILKNNNISFPYSVEVARTSKEQRIGMMFRDNVLKNTGMLFLFKDEIERSFWMKNTLIPLDIIFIDHDGVIINIHHMAEPESLTPIKSNGIAKAVLEIAGGSTEILGIHEGDVVIYKDFSNNDNMK